MSAAPQSNANAIFERSADAAEIVVNCHRAVGEHEPGEYLVTFEDNGDVLIEQLSDEPGAGANALTGDGRQRVVSVGSGGDDITVIAYIDGTLYATPFTFASSQEVNTDGGE